MDFNFDFNPQEILDEVRDASPAPAPGAKYSNLGQYGHDMVVAATQKSINRALRKQLQLRTPSSFAIAYKSDDNNNLVQVDIDVFQSVVGPLSDMPDEAHKEDERVAALDKMDFDSAFFGEFGLPSGVDEEKLELVTFDQGTSRVSYHLFFASLTICTLVERGDNLVWQKITQPKGQPWVFRFSVDLNMRADDEEAFNKLPERVKEQLRNLNPNSAFSLTQLMLDLNSASLQDSPAIEGLDPNTNKRVYDTIARVIIDNYWKPLQESGGVILSYGVVPANPNPQTPSIVPTDVSIVLSANRDGQGNETHNYGLYTLNHLIMSENHTMPPPGQFSWNWFADGEDIAGQSLGVVAINHDTFSHHLVNLLRKNWQEFPGFPPFDFGGWQSRTDVPRIDIITGLLNFRTEAVQNGFDFTIFGGVEVNGNMIQMDMRAVADVPPPYQMFYSGRVIDYSCIVKYVLQVDPSGTLRVQMSDHQFVNQSVSKFEQFATQLNPQNLFSSIQNAMTAMFSGSHVWIFPGGQIVAYKDACFSYFGDLILHFIYEPQFD